MKGRIAGRRQLASLPMQIIYRGLFKLSGDRWRHRTTVQKYNVLEVQALTCSRTSGLLNGLCSVESPVSVFPDTLL